MQVRNMSGNELGILVCDALGISPDCVSEISISMRPFEPALVTITHRVANPVAKEIAEAVSQFELTKKPA